MEVQMTNACGRCKKTETRPVEIEEVIEARQRQERQEAIESQIDAFLNQNDEIALEDCPQLIILVKTSGGIRMRSLDRLCSGGTGKRKGCESRVASLVNEIFMENKKKPKKKATSEAGGTEE